MPGGGAGGGGGGGPAPAGTVSETMVTLEALEGAGGPVIRDPGLRWTLVWLDRGQTLLDGNSMAQPMLNLAPGRYAAQATLGGRDGATEFVVAGRAAETHQVVLPAPTSAPTSSLQEDLARYNAWLEAAGQPESMRTPILEQFGKLPPEIRAQILESMQ